MSSAWPPEGFVYGIDVARFQDSDGDGTGDLPGLETRLDHVAGLGAEWVWLLPIFPSLRRDNGYDVDDHESVDPRFGTLDDFASVIDACHRRGLRVMIDLIIHHTSERHRWFLEARQNPASDAGDYYVWADKPRDEAGDEPIFAGEEDSVWAFDPDAKAWYHHRFYGFQPDLNVTNDDVFDELVRIAKLWLDRGVDGFRIDAALPAMKAGPGETPADAAQFYRRLRARLSDARPDVVLAAEADAPPHELNSITAHEQVDAVVDFSLNNALFLALARGQAAPLYTALGQLDRSVQPSARLNFVRNVDELDLAQLTDAERQEVFDAFGDGPDDFIYGRGLRRGWRPLMGDERRFRMSLSLLFALPGVPLLMYGQELGVGDDPTAPGRDAARPVMQWRPARSGGFTTGESDLVLPAQRDGEFDFAHVNVRDESTDDASTLVLTRRVATLRARAGAATKPARPRILPHAPSVLALNLGGCLTLHNLGEAPAEVFEAYGAKPLLYERWNGHRLGPFGFAWFRS
ncbi:alpha-amylase family glycosyl hydrolase [Gryllotalpicola reticulitermitis]|uniref:Alpha-amylase family glycosyl hydrolase n=1 Tax=Gryllotalpicola reticulitermitis TaxID=1184153 RepID=A0ABV8Q595_9MICO